MNIDSEIEDYEVGYGKPPKSGQFRKGVTGNPLGRPKKEPDFESQVLRELNSKLTVNENGKRRVITKYEGMAKQLVNKALSGNLAAARLVILHYQQAREKLAEEFKKSPSNPNLDFRNLSDEELIEFIKADVEKSIRPQLEKSIRAKLTRSIRADLEKSMRAKLEKSIRAEFEMSIGHGEGLQKSGDRRVVGK
jgi:polyribonucleotide nucleotidyltransferase